LITFDLNILLDKLTVYGIRGNCLDWIRRYLTSRKEWAYVDLNEVKFDIMLQATSFYYLYQ